MMKAKALYLAPLALLACGGEDDAPPCDPTVVGSICTIAGDGRSGYAGDEGPAVEARMSLPQDTLRIGETLFILDWNNHRIRKLDPDGIIRHVAGRGELGGTLDDPANSDLNHPTGMVYEQGLDRLIVAAWHNSKLRTIDLASGEILDECGDGRRAYFGDNGPALTSSLDLPASLAFAPNGDLVIMDQANQVLRSVDAGGNISRLAGRCVVDADPPLGGGQCAPGIEPSPCPPPSNKFTCGAMATCMAPCTPGYGGDDDNVALNLRMAQPFGQSADPAGRIAFDAEGNLYFADTSNALIRKIDTAGNVTRVAGQAPVDGMASNGYSGDGGAATAAQLFNPVDLAFDSDGSLYFSDVYNHCIRRIANGMIETVVGTCTEQGYSGDGGPASEATLKRPYGIEVTGDTLYISDTGNNVIRSVKLR